MGSEMCIRDSSGADDLKDACSRVKAFFSKIGVLVNCAGQFTEMPVKEATYQDFLEEALINLIAPQAICADLLPLIIPDRGCIVNVSSIAALKGYYTGGIYAPTKAALTNFSQCLRLNCEPQGISVVTVMPGVTNTRMHEGSDKYDSSKMLQPEEVAKQIYEAATSEGCVSELVLHPRKNARSLN